MFHKFSPLFGALSYPQSNFRNTISKESNNISSCLLESKLLFMIIQSHYADTKILCATIGPDKFLFTYFLFCLCKLSIKEEHKWKTSQSGFKVVKIVAVRMKRRDDI